MRSRLRLVLIIVALVLVAGVLWLVWGPRQNERATLSGYVEGEPLYLASPISGLVTDMAVSRGQRVEAGALLFTVDARSLAAQSDEAQAQIEQAKAQISAASASHGQLAAAAQAAHASAAEAEREADRATSLYRDKPGAIARQDVDKAAAAATSANAQYQAAERQAAAAEDQVGTARAALAQAMGAHADAEARLSQVSPTAPSASRVEDTFFQTGEWATANQPAVSLLPDAKIKLRFFVPEAAVSAYRPGESVRFACDGCAKGLVATIDYVSPRPEYTPPEIYSRQSRQALVFLIEAAPADPKVLAPGQPVDVTPLEPAR